MKLTLFTKLLAFFLLPFLLFCGREKRGFDNPEFREFISPAFSLNKTYRSMKGPMSNVQISLIDSEKPELVWVTAYKVIAIDGRENRQVSQEYVCHTNLMLNTRLHRKKLANSTILKPRMFTLSQGQYEINLPAGFGIPIISNEPMQLQTQLLNNNRQKNGPSHVRHKITVSFIRDQDLKEPIKPLYQVSAAMRVAVENKEMVWGVAKPTALQRKATSSVGQNAAKHVYRDKFNRAFTQHWVIKPGKTINHTLATYAMNIPYDTQVHYMAVHLHPMAESMSLTDLTSGKELFKFKAQNASGKLGLVKVNHYSSTKGFRIFKEHDYRITSVYNNNSGQDQDAMATIFLYLLDRKFKKPDFASL